jgi:serine protease Do
MFNNIKVKIMFKLKQKLSVRMTLLIAGFITGILFIATIGTSNKSVQGGDKVAFGSTPALTVQGKELLNQFSTAFEAAADKVNSSVVPIFSEQVTKVTNPFGSAEDPFRQFFGDDFFKHFFGNNNGGEQKQTIHALGSGVIVSNDGYILTNNHVVDGADKLTVVLKDEQKYTAKVVGRDPQSDVAVIKIDAKDLPAASLGNSDEARVGQWVIAVGNPFQLMHTVTAGIISAKGRSSVNLAEYEDFIQTDASINMGNSGGALADLDGNVIGINTAILNPTGTGGNVGIGFAIPINMAKNVMDQLIKNGKIVRGYLGILPQDINDNLAKALNLKSTEGSLVGDVTPDGPADKGGIKRGDIITKFNGTKIENSTQLRNVVASSEPGKEIKVDILRDTKELEKNITLAERPTNIAENKAGSESTEKGTSKMLGLSVQTLSGNLASQLGYKDDHGVVVTDVKPGSPAEDAGIQPNDLIKEVNRSSVSSVQEFDHIVDKIKNGDNVAFLVRRGQNTFFVAIQMPNA